MSATSEIQMELSEEERISISETSSINLKYISRCILIGENNNNNQQQQYPTTNNNRLLPCNNNCNTNNYKFNRFWVNNLHFERIFLFPPPTLNTNNQQQTTAGASSHSHQQPNMFSGNIQTLNIYNKWKVPTRIIVTLWWFIFFFDILYFLPYDIKIIRLDWHAMITWL